MTEMEMKAKFEALYIDPTSLKKIQYWADAADGEVSGLGIVEVENGRYVVRDVFILEQECSGADTELKPEAISKLITDIIKAGKDPAKLKFWWHSHVNMSVFWSGTDDECAETLSTEYAFSLVVNKAKERRVRLDLYKPFRITVDHLRIVELSSDDEELKKSCEKDVKDKVKSKSYGWNGTEDWRKTRGHGYFGGGYGFGDEDEYFKSNFGYGKNEEKRPHGWGKRVKLSENEVDDINNLKSTISSKGFSPESIEEFVKESFKNYSRIKLDSKSGCRDGFLTFEVDSQICQSCKIAKLCETLSERFGDEEFKPQTDEVVNGAIEVVVDRGREDDGNE